MRRVLRAAIASGLVHGAASLFFEQPPAQDIEGATVSKPTFGEQPPAQGMEAPTFGEQLPAQGMEDPAFMKQPPAYDMEGATLSKPAFGEQPPAQGMEVTIPPALNAQEDPTFGKQPPAYDMEGAISSKPAFGEQPPAQGLEDATFGEQPPAQGMEEPVPMKQPPAQGTEGPALVEEPPEEVIDIQDPIIGVRHVKRDPTLPNFGEKHVLDPYKFPNAKCLDGSSGAYYFSPGHNAKSNGLKKFYIFKMGGGGCGSYRDCSSRAFSLLGSSEEKHGWLPYMDLHGLNGFPHIGMDRSEANNPLMWDWNHVVIIYCDGGFFAGSNSTPTYENGQRLYFNGADIQEAVMADLDEKYGLSKAEDMVVGGCSAGSLGTFMTIDWLNKHPATPKHGRVAGLTCSGFFLDNDEAWYTSSKAFPFWAFNVTGSVDPGCISANPAPNTHKCFIPEINAQYIKTPMFFWESQYDQWQLRNLYKIKCWSTKCANKHGDHVMSAMQKIWAIKPHTAGFLSSCVHHCEDSDMGDVANINPIDGDLPLVAFAKWYRGYFSNLRLVQRRIWHYNATFPCRECCPQGPSGSRDTIYNGLE